MEFAYIFFMGFTSWIIGVFGFAQIIGSIRTRQKNFYIPIAVWLAILIFALFIAKWLFPQFINAFYLGYALSLIVILLQKKIE